MSLSNEVLKWKYVNVIYVVAVQRGINIGRKMLLIFEMEGVFFSSYARDDPSCHIQRNPDWEFGELSYFFSPFQSEVLKYCLKNYYVAICTSNATDKYVQQVLEKLNIDIRDFEFTWNMSHCHLQTKFKAGSTIQFYEKRLTDVWSQYGDKYKESNFLLIDTSNLTSSFVRYRSNHILIKTYTGQEQDTWLQHVLFPFLKTLHRIKEKFEYIRRFNRTSTLL